MSAIDGREVGRPRSDKRTKLWPGNAGDLTRGRAFNAALCADLEAAGHEVFLPQRDGVEADKALAPLQRRYESLVDDFEHLDAVLDEGASKAVVMASDTMKRVEEAIGVTALHAD